MSAKDLEMSKSQAIVAFLYNLAIGLGAVIWLTRIGPNVSFGAPLGMAPIAAVCLLGAAMGSVHGLASISAHAGKRNLEASWFTFYLARPITGAGMSLITMLVLKGSIGGFEVNDEKALLAWAALAGLYSQPALDKLKEVFATFLRTKANDDSNPKPPGTAGPVAMVFPATPSSGPAVISNVGAAPGTTPGPAPAGSATFQALALKPVAAKPEQDDQG